MSGINVTNHAKQRIKERTGINMKGVERSAENAMEKGLKHCELNGSLRKYVDGLYLREKKANNMRIYSQHVYMFRNDTLITIIPLPHRYHSLVEKLKSKREDSV